MSDTAQYVEHGFTLSAGQLKDIDRAIKNKTNVKLKFSKDQVTGEHILLITKTQLNKIKRNAEKNMGVVINFSAAQLQATKKRGGILPLLALIPLIAGIAGGVGGLASGAAGIAKAVNDKKAADLAQAELERHNREIEKEVQGSGCSQICTHCQGSGLFLKQ